MRVIRKQYLFRNAEDLSLNRAMAAALLFLIAPAFALAAAASDAGDCTRGKACGAELLDTPHAVWAETIKLTGARETRSENMHSLSFQEAGALEQVPDSILDDVVRVDRGYMFSLQRNRLRENLRGKPRFMGREPAGRALAIASTFIYEPESRPADVWIRPNHDGKHPGPRVTSTRILVEPESLGDLQNVLIMELNGRFETESGAGPWLRFLPEWSIAWLLILGLLVVILRRAPLRYRSNGL